MKNFLNSKTLWFNKILIGIGLTLTFAESQFHLLQHYLPPDQYGLVLFSIGVIGYILRLVTDSPIVKN